MTIPKFNHRRSAKGKTGAKGKPALLHPRNPHQGRYDFDQLCRANPDLAGFIKVNPYLEGSVDAGSAQTIDFSDAAAVLNLNKALLAHFYQVRHWQIPAEYLCPPIPGRADHLHYLADLLADGGEVPTGKGVKVLDIGTGANCIYPIIGSQTFGWKFFGTEIDPVALNVAAVIVKANSCLQKHVTLYHQAQSDAIFAGIIQPGDQFALSMCNPPFHGSLAEAQASNARKVENLNKNRGVAASQTPLKAVAESNFGGQRAELWCPGGELAFISQMINESFQYASQVGWFSSLVSKGEHLYALEKLIHKRGAKECRVIKMAQGQKISHLIAWRF